MALVPIGGQKISYKGSSNTGIGYQNYSHGFGDFNVENGDKFFFTMNLASNSDSSIFLDSGKTNKLYLGSETYDLINDLNWSRRGSSISNGDFWAETRMIHDVTNQSGTISCSIEYSMTSYGAASPTLYKWSC